jgi:AraC-like DNA-binding protein
VSDIRHQPEVPTRALAYLAGDVIDRHRHDEHQLIYVSTGVIAITPGHGSWVAAPDRAVWIPAGIWHEHRFYGRTSFHSVGFTSAAAPLPGDTPTVVAAGGLIRELMIACTEDGLRPAEERRIRAVLIDRLGRVEVQPLSLPRAQDPRLAEACQLVTDDLSQPRPVGWLARATGTSDRTLTRLFRTEFGMTYPQWRTQTRVLHALINLAEGASVTETGRRCGFATASAFIDAFTRTMGQTPGRYRASSAGLPTRPAVLLRLSSACPGHLGGTLAAGWHGNQCTSGPLLAALRRAVADSGSMPWLVVMPSRSRWSPQRYCSVEMLLAMVAAAATTRGNWPAGASASAWCRAAIRSAVDGEPGWFRSAMSRATELNT